MFQSIPFLYDQELFDAITLYNYSLSTFKNYRSHLRRMSLFFDCDPKELSLEQCKQYLLHMTLEQKLGPDTTNTARSAFLFFQQAVLGNPMDSRLLPRRKIHRPQPLLPSPQEVLSLLASIHSIKYRAVLSLCYGSGLRISEALSLKISHIDSSRMQVYVEFGKRGSSRHSILSSYSLLLLRQYYRKYRPSGLFLFPAKDRDVPMPKQHIQQAIRTAAAQVLPSYEKITSHTLRHCFATHCLDAGYDLRTIQMLLGHRSITSTSVYLNLSTGHFSSLKSPADLAGGDLLV